MPDSFVRLPPDGTGKRLSARHRTVGGVEVYEQHVIAADSDRVVSFLGYTGSLRIPGNAATPQVLWTLSNSGTSTVRVALRSLRVISASTAASTVMNPWYHLQRVTGTPSGGTAMTKVGRRSEGGNADVVVRVGASADGTAVAITTPALDSTRRMWTGFAERAHTLVGDLGGKDDSPFEIDPSDPPELAPGEAFVLALHVAAAADNIATRSFLVVSAFEEYTIP